MSRRFLRVLVGIVTVVSLSGCSYNEERAIRSDLDREWRGITVSDFSDFEATSTIELKLADDSRVADYVRYAMLHNPGLKAAFQAWRAAIEKIAQARSLPDPKITYANFIRSSETRVGPQKNTFSLAQQIPWPAKLVHRSDKALRLARRQGYVFDAKRLTLYYQVQKVYFEYAYLARAIAILEDNIKLLKGIEGSIRIRYKAAAASHHSLIQTQVELGKLEDRLNTLLALRPALAARLNATLGRDVNVAVPWPKDKMAKPDTPDEAALLAELLKKNPELEAAREAIRAAEVSRKLAKDLYKPDFGIGVSYVETDNRSDASPEDNGKDPVIAMLQMTLPVWIGKYRAATRQATAELQAAKKQREDKANRLSADLRLAFFNYGDAGRKLNLFRDTLIPKAQQALTATQTSFSAGKATYLDMIDAERTLLEFQLLSERALVDRAIRFAELEMLSGKDLGQSIPAE